MPPFVTQSDPQFEESPAILAARERARRIAVSDLPILIEGEAGTGRRTLATSILQLRTEQSGHPMAVIEGVQGITGDFRGQFQSATPSQMEVLIYNLESLSPRELAELSSLVHRKLIRLIAVLKHRISDADAGASAASCALELEVENGATRVTLPPLRERGDDATRWAIYFLRRASERLTLPIPDLSRGALSAIHRHRWPGNLIELDAVMSRAICLSASSNLDASDIGLVDNEATIQPLSEALEQFRTTYINRALAYFSGNRSQTARALGIDVRTIFRYLKKE